MTDAKSERLQDELSQQDKEANKKVKRIVRADRRFYADSLAAQADEATVKEVLEQITKLVCDKHRNKSDPPIKFGKRFATKRERDSL